MPTETKIIRILKKIVKDVPRQRLLITQKLAESKLSTDLDFDVEPPTKLEAITTFDARVSRELTPMLRARFEFGSTIHYFTEVWPALGSTRSLIKNAVVVATHRSLRENWDSSAPATFPDGALALASYSPRVRQNIAYFVWLNDGDEPQVWQYAQMSEIRFRNYYEYLASYIETGLIGS